MKPIVENAYLNGDFCNRTVTRKEGGVIEIHLSKLYYQKEAVFAAAHSVTDNYRAKIAPADQRNVKITLIPLREETKASEDKVINDLMNRLIDEQVRMDLEKQYGKIRELIIEHAFSPIENLRAKVREIVGRD
jgi:His-Xaa-Ser system protein HxsD